MLENIAKQLGGNACAKKKQHIDRTDSPKKRLKPPKKKQKSNSL